MLLTEPFAMLSMPLFDFHLPPCTEGFLIHLSPLWQLPLWQLPLFPSVAQFPCVHDQVYLFLTTNSILHPSQSGFRSGHSTNTALLDVSDFILNNMNEGRATAAIFLDLKKAFDTVNHDTLISKLHCYGIKGSAVNWFISYLTDMSQVVTINSHLSDSQNINIGVPQGSILGP